MKNKLQLLFFFFGIMVCFYSCTSEEKVTDSEAKSAHLAELTYTDVSYGSHEQQIFDLYLPQGRSSEKTKVIVLVHGGGWIEGDKADMERFIEPFRERFPKHAIVNMNYVLASLEAPVVPAFPNQFLDIKAAITKITSEKDNYQILPEFALVGSSAGAHLSLMYDFVYDVENQVKFVANIVGPTDFTDPFYSSDPDFFTVLSILVDENQYGEDTNYAEATSPVFHVSSASSPVVMFYGTQDPIVPLSNGTNLGEALTAAKVPHSFTSYLGGHVGDWSIEDIRNMYSQIEEYVESYLPVD